MRHTNAPLPWATEADMCDAFIASARAEGLRVYPETCGYDMVVELPDGTQVGVEAKLRANLEVLAQITERKTRPWRMKPDAHAVLVGREARFFTSVALGLGVLVLYGHDKSIGSIGLRIARWVEAAPRQQPQQRLPLPAEEPQLRAGTPSPLQHTHWKALASRFSLTLRSRDTVTRADIVEAGLSPTIWLRRWLEPAGTMPGPKGRARTLYRVRDGVVLPGEETRS